MPGAGPVGITAGADRALWFAEILAGQIGRISPDGKISEFPLPDRAAKPHAIVADPSGGCWFTEWAANRIGHISPDGAFRHYDLPTPASEPHGLTVAPDGAVWAALETGAAARLAPGPEPAGRAERVAGWSARRMPMAVRRLTGPGRAA
jgi:virginiamycin B lyase